VEVEFRATVSEYLTMSALVLPSIALLIGLVALGAAGATPRRHRWLQITLFALGAISTAAALILFYRAGGFEALAFVGSAMIVVTGIGVLAWYFLSFVGTADDALSTGNAPPPTPDFSFLHQSQDKR
jgi:hypothetical protein